MNAASTPYPLGPAGRRTGITSHGNGLGTREHQRSRPKAALLAKDQLKLGGSVTQSSQRLPLFTLRLPRVTHDATVTQRDST
jgi:hypothetical protein